MKKALILTTTSGFLSQFELNNVRLLQEKGYQIHYATNFGVPIYEVKDQALVDMGIILHHISIEKSPFSIKKNIWAYRELKRIIDREKIDVVHCHNPVGGLLGRLSAHMSKRKPYVIYTAHGFHFFTGAPLKNWLFYYPVERYLAKYTDIIITINHEDYERAGSFKYKPDGHAEIIPSVGVDTAKYYPESSEYEGDIFHIVSAGELNANKNHKVVIDAIAKLGNPNIYYNICGEGPLRKELQEYIDSKHLGGQVFLRGYCYDMPQMLHNADLFIFPSYREGMGMAALEAMASGVPIIAADNRGTREYMQNGENGLVCKPDSAQEFADAIRTMYDSKELRQKYASNALKTIERFTLQKAAEKMHQIYQVLPESAQTQKSETEDRPMISVIMGVFNQNDFAALEAAVSSILNQTYKDFEFLIYNDGSRKEVGEYISKLEQRDKRIKVIDSKENHGLGYALNRCIEKATGKYLARMDADDISHPKRLQTEIEFLEKNKEYMWCGTNCDIFDREGKWADGTRPEEPKAKDYLKYSPYIHPSVMYRASLFDRIVGYSEEKETRRCEDYELFMRLYELGYKGYNIQQPLLKYFVDRRKYHSRSIKDSIYEGQIRIRGYRKMGLLWPKGWLYVLRPIASKILPLGIVRFYKERIAEL